MLCAPTSGGHFNPAITLCFAIWSGFPWKKVPHYIFSQIVGAFVAGMVLMGCYWPMIAAEKHKVLAAGHGDRTPFFETGGLATILCPFPANGQTNLGYIFFQEFFIDSYIGLVIWGSLDPANPFVTPVSVPFTIGIAYASMIWGVGANTISTNLARDLGTRFVAAIFFGPQAFTYDHYPWISVLVNIPATIFATGYYEFLLRDSLQKIHKGHAEHEAGEAGLIKHITKVAEPGIIVSADKDDDDDGAALATSTGRATGDAKADMRSPVRGEKDDDTLNSGHTLSHEQY